MAIHIDPVLAASVGFRPRIFYRNHFLTGQVAASSEQVQHPLEFAFDGFTDTAWIGESEAANWWLSVQKPGATADYLAITVWREKDENGEHLPLTVVIQTSVDGETWNDVILPYPLKPKDRILGFMFPETTSTHWRVLFTGDAPPQVVDVSLGMSTPLPRGFPPGSEPPSKARNNKIMNNTTEQGHLVGRSVIRKGIRTSFTLQNLPPKWIKEEWDDLINHIEVRPFYVAWNPKDWPEEFAFVWANRDIRPPNFSNTLELRATIEVEGYAE